MMRRSCAIAVPLTRRSPPSSVVAVESIGELPVELRWLNVKPSRFGTVRSLLDVLDYCEREGIRLYGGGQFELGVGREHIQALASLFYPAGATSFGASGYNDLELGNDLPTGPASAG